MKSKSEFDFNVGLDILQNKVPKMRRLGLSKATCHCGFCEGKDTVIITRFPGRRGDVVRWKCKVEGCGNMGMT